MLRALLALWVLAGPAWAGTFDLPEETENRLPFKLSGLLDLRYAHTSQQLGWLQGGTNKLRYGGKDLNGNGGGDRDANVLAIPQASLVLDVPLPQQASVHAQANLDLDQNNSPASIGIVEAFGDIARRRGDWAGRLRAGGLIPPVSLEHPETAWSTRYTLTPSAIGSWISEEVRVFGAEGSAEYSSGQSSARLTAAAFSGGDQVGELLLVRGWALHDYQAVLTQTYALPNGKTEQPFRELDGRAGFYGRSQLAFGGDALKLTGGYWDNNGNINATSLENGATLGTWRTQFWDGGAKLEWRRLTLLGQFMRGASASAVFTRRYWQAWYALGSYELGRWRLSGRFDKFDVDRRRWEYGYSMTGALQWDWTLAQRLSLEYVYVLARPNEFIRPRSEKDQIVQADWRLRFGH